MTPRKPSAKRDPSARSTGRSGATAAPGGGNVLHALVAAYVRGERTADEVREAAIAVPGLQAFARTCLGVIDRKRYKVRIHLEKYIRGTKVTLVELSSQHAGVTVCLL